MNKNQTAERPQLREAVTSKKRTAKEDLNYERESKKTATETAIASPEENKRASTPPPPELKQQERTPGRVGPIKHEDFSLKPDIKPFKGEKGKKVRKTQWEKDEEYKQFVRDNEGHPFHDLHVCFDKGPNGSPTYDKSGFELSYEKVADWMEPKAYNKGKMMRGMDRTIDKIQREKERMKEIFFEKGEAPERVETCQADAWKDRVSKDLNIPWHKVGVAEFEEWERRGFKKARKGEYETFTDEEKKRFTRLLSGASLRK